VTLAAVTGVAVGQSAGLNLSTSGAVAPGTVVTAVNNATLAITISTPTTAALPASTRLYFGATAQSGSPIELQRTAYDAYLRGNWRSAGCSGLIDIDATVADQVNQGKWRTDLGQGSSDGVHPSAALHQAAVNAGLITPSMLALP
jgi:hypothetical protein